MTNKSKKSQATVIFHSGYKGQETPRSVFIDGQEVEILRILSQQRVRDVHLPETRDVFECQTSRGTLIITLYEDGSTDCRFKAGANRKT